MGLAVAWAVASIATMRSGSGLAALPDQLGFAVGLGIAGLYLAWRGTQRSRPPVALEITELGMAFAGRLIPWEDVAEVQLTEGEIGPAGQVFKVRLDDLTVSLRDGTRLTVPREVLGEEPLGPWDAVLDAIRAAAPSVPISD